MTAEGRSRDGPVRLPSLRSLRGGWGAALDGEPLQMGERGGVSLWEFEVSPPA